jgi:leucyl-tRNA synthetase
MKRYSPKEIEPKWQKKWEQDGIYRTDDSSDKPKRYVLEYFPYPSGAAMHVGHVRNYTIGDAVARFYRMRGYNVLHPMGWDSFGLPAENFAIKNGISPQQAIEQNTTKFKQQLTQMGFSYDWSREINSSDPSYYKWTQWFFLLLLKKGLAYQKDSLQWWCETDGTVLANEQVENGKCWRCGDEVSKKPLKQWFFKITDYADRLIEDLNDLDWSESIKAMQINWIGKSEGAEIHFEVDGSSHKIEVFTTRPDTLFGSTFMVLAPEHPLVEKLTTDEQKRAVEDYVGATQAKSDVERLEVNRVKSGVFTGAYAINPVNNEKLPVWVADYVLYGYGTGAIMAVPAHDERDFEFANKFKLEVRQVIKSKEDQVEDVAVYKGEGLMVNSGKFDGLESSEAREKIVADLAAEGLGSEKRNYKLRDWLISRQRYWGAPIPVVHCPDDGVVPVPDNQLPVVLPEIDSYKPTGEGTSVLASVHEWVDTECPKCGKPAKRETDTMDGFACSSWYFLRFADPHNDKEPFDAQKSSYWLPVDDYIGGAEHAVMHLLYSRMWTKVMYDEGLIEFQEPFRALRNHGMILAPDGRKMSKSWGNVIAPDDLISQGYGADSIRIMELFIGPWNQSANWSVEGMGGSFRFIQRFWTLAQEYTDQSEEQTSKKSVKEAELQKLIHKTIFKVSDDLHSMSFNTAISALMACLNQLYKLKAEYGFEPRELWGEVIAIFAQLLAPFAPHITEEIWASLGKGCSVHLSEWPQHEEKYLVQEVVTIVVQVNGKVRQNLSLPVDSGSDEVEKAALEDGKVKAQVEGKQIVKTIIVSNKLINFVVK